MKAKKIVPARTKAQIDQEYSNHAMQFGHKTAEIEALTAQLADHKKSMTELREEAARFAAEVPLEKA